MMAAAHLLLIALLELLAANNQQPVEEVKNIGSFNGAI